MSQSNQCANMFLSVKKKKNLTPIPYCAMVQFRMSIPRSFQIQYYSMVLLYTKNLQTAPLTSEG